MKADDDGAPTGEHLFDTSGKQCYPAWRYNGKGGAKIVANPIEDQALGKGWYDNPDPAHRSSAAKSEVAAAVPDKK